MKQTRFVKLAGCGNDFLLVDARTRSFQGNPSRLARAWCDRKRGIGADGLLLALPSRKADARMRIFNPDGSEPSMCGNGLRCLAWYLHTTNGRDRRFRVETRAGFMKAEIVSKKRVRIYMTPPRRLHLGLKVTQQGRRYLLHAVDTGVPHAVLLSRWIQKMDLDRLGPFIRNHRLFRPEGTNVNLVQIRSPHRIDLRTYERGVEAETLACGTGAVASVVIGAALGRLASPVQVQTRGGEKLQVGFQSLPKPWEGLYLEGPVQFLFEGGIPL
jgi:diaminopimelate epimerase